MSTAPHPIYNMAFLKHVFPYFAFFFVLYSKLCCESGEYEYWISQRYYKFMSEQRTFVALNFLFYVFMTFDHCMNRAHRACGIWLYFVWNCYTLIYTFRNHLFLHYIQFRFIHRFYYLKCKICLMTDFFSYKIIWYWAKSDYTVGLS